MVFYTRFNHPSPPGITFEGESLTVQDFEYECNINSVIASFTQTGVLPERSDSPVYGDFAAVGDFASIQQTLVDTYEKFDALPAAIRKRFSNDPGELIAFLNDSSNRDEAISLGLVNKSADNVDNIDEA